MKYSCNIYLISLPRPRKSPVEPVPESGAGDASAVKSRTAPYYDERYRERREREREREPANPERERERERDHRRDARH